MTMNDYFALNSLNSVWLSPIVRLSKNNCVEINKDRHILSTAQIFGKDSSFGNIRFVRIFVGKEHVKGQWGRALTLVLNIFSWLSKTIA